MWYRYNIFFLVKRSIVLRYRYTGVYIYMVDFFLSDCARAGRYLLVDSFARFPLGWMLVIK